MLASNKLALSVLTCLTGWPGESASWPVQVSFGLPLSPFAFCCRSFSPSFVTKVTSSTFNHLVSLLSVTGSLWLIKYLCIEWLASRITPSQVFFGEISFSLPILIVRTFSKHLAFLKQSLLLPYILSGPSSSSSSADERRMYACWSNDEETMLLRLRAENFDRLKSREARKRGKTSPRKWKINSVPRKQQTSTRRRWSTLSIDTSRPKTGTASSLKEMEGNQLIMMKLTKFWAVATSLPFKMSDKRTTGWSLMILWDLASYKLINDRRETIKAFQIKCIKYYPEQDPTSQPNCPPKQRNLTIPYSQKKS